MSIWGIHLICRKLVDPTFRDNNEFLNFLTRQPSNPQWNRLNNRTVELGENDE